jgi:hypothetical protein
MRAALVLIAFCLPTAAAAQGAIQNQRDFVHDTEAAQARQRDIFIQNELMGLDTRIRTDQALRGVPGFSSLQIPIIPMPTSAPPPQVGPFAAIPDAKLADSNQRVRAAARKRPWTIGGALGRDRR